MLWAFCLVTLISQGEIIDRIAVAVGNQFITESEILRDIRITAFLNDTELDFSPKAKRQAADRLVEQKLVNKEIELTKYPGPEAEEIAQMLENTRKLRATNPEQFQRELEKYGIRGGGPEGAPGPATDVAAVRGSEVPSRRAGH